jgi:predicted anti-sigma-YlaC factor YlaD
VLAARSDSTGGDCRGTRLACSLQLDGELTLRGRKRLARHLRCCGSCRSFARRLEAITDLLRAGQHKEVAHFAP